MNFEQINTSCPICMGPFVEPCTIGCSHMFCKSCMERWVNSGAWNSYKCPVCRKKYVSLFVMPDNFLKSRYKTRSVTGPWRSMQLYNNIWQIIDNIGNLKTHEEKCEELNKMLQYIYDNKWILNDAKGFFDQTNPNNIFTSFRMTLKEKLKDFSEKHLWGEAQIWEYKFRDILE